MFLFVPTVRHPLFGDFSKQALLAKICESPAAVAFTKPQSHMNQHSLFLRFRFGDFL